MQRSARSSLQVNRARGARPLIVSFGLFRLSSENDAMNEDDTIGIEELSELLGVGTHVLRYWESVFPMFRPITGRKGKRRYTRAAVQVVQRIRELLYNEKQTIDGARRRLRAELGDKGHG